MSYITPPPASSSGSGNFVQAQVNFGFPTGQEGDTAKVTVTGQPWVTGSSIIICNAASIATADHDPDDVLVEGIVAYAQNLVPGVGFDIVALAPQNSWGRYLINASGQ